MSLARIAQRRRERLGLSATNDHLRCLGRNFTAVAFMHGSYEMGYDAGHDAGVDEAERALEEINARAAGVTP